MMVARSTSPVMALAPSHAHVNTWEDPGIVGADLDGRLRQNATRNSVLRGCSARPWHRFGMGSPGDDIDSQRPVAGLRHRCQLVQWRKCGLAGHGALRI